MEKTKPRIIGLRGYTILSKEQPKEPEYSFLFTYPSSNTINNPIKPPIQKKTGILDSLLEMFGRKR